MKLRARLLISFVFAREGAGAAGRAAGAVDHLLCHGAGPAASGRAQGMDALSSQASLSGYERVLLAATHLARVFPRMTTAAGR